MKTIHFFIIVLISSFMMLVSCTKDFCEDSVCMNGGTCINGACECSFGFTGVNCAEQITPDKIRIRTIQVTRFPGLNAGTSWDDGDGPDLYFRLYEGDEPLAQPMLTVENADEREDYFFFIDIIDVRNVFSEHSLQLKDYDVDDPDDFMGEVKFSLYNETNGLPEKIVIDNGGNVAFTVELEYLYNSDIK